MIEERTWRKISNRWVSRKPPKLKMASREYWERDLQYRGQIAILDAGLGALSSRDGFVRALSFARRSVDVVLNSVEVRFFQRGLEREYLGLIALIAMGGEGRSSRSLRSPSMGWRVRKLAPVNVRRRSGRLWNEFEFTLEAWEVWYERVRVKLLRSRLRRVGNWDIYLEENRFLRSSDRNRVGARGMVYQRLAEALAGKLAYTDVFEALARVRTEFALRKVLIGGERDLTALWCDTCDEVERRLRDYVAGASLGKTFCKTRPSSKDYKKPRSKRV